MLLCFFFFFFQAEDGIRDLVRSRGLGDVYKRQELDRELERRGHRFGRYADDCNIYVRSERAGQRVMESVSSFLVKKLKLRVNGEKSAVAKVGERSFLGFGFLNRKEPKRRIAPKAIRRFKERVRGLTRRTRGISIGRMAKELSAY